MELQEKQEGISNHEQKAVANKAATINRDPRIQNKMNRK
jgi:hypothetical protein